VARQLRASPSAPSTSVLLPGARTTASPPGSPTPSPSSATATRLVLSVTPQVTRLGAPVIATVTVARWSGGPADRTIGGSPSPATGATPSTGPSPVVAVPARPSQALAGQRSPSVSGRPGSPPDTPEPAVRTDVTLLRLDWGDGTTDAQRLRCPVSGATSGATPAPGSATAGAPADAAVTDDGAGGLLREPLTFRHFFRKPGAYTVVVTVAGTPCWSTAGPLEATVVVRGG